MLTEQGMPTIVIDVQVLYPCGTGCHIDTHRTELFFLFLHPDDGRRTTREECRRQTDALRAMERVGFTHEDYKRYALTCL